MIFLTHIRCAKATISQLSRQERGGVLVEFAIVISLFLFLFFTIVDFGRLAFTAVMAEKGSQIAIRTAIVRPPACLNVPNRHARGTAAPGPRFGTSCKSQAGTCLVVAQITCNASTANFDSNGPATEIWARIQPLLPNTATIDSLQFTYQFDPNLGFLGGPYTPMVTVDLTLPQFQFISPLGTLATAAGGSNANSLGTALTLPSYSESLPAEDLALGIAG